MRTETFRVRRLGAVRIVNPEPIRILDMTWRYGSIVKVEPGGVFRALVRDALRTLAMYQPPRAPCDPDDAPPDVLVLRPHADFPLLAEGCIRDVEDFDPPCREHAPDAPASAAAIGDVGRVPRPRVVRATPPHAIREYASGGPYRSEARVERLNRLSGRFTIRPGGTMTVFTFLGEAPRALLKVRYRASPDAPPNECPRATGSTCRKAISCRWNGPPSSSPCSKPSRSATSAPSCDPSDRGVVFSSRRKKEPRRAQALSGGAGPSSSSRWRATKRSATRVRDLTRRARVNASKAFRLRIAAARSTTRSARSSATIFGGSA